jgi:hypothetical protein
MWYSFQLEFSI